MPDIFNDITPPPGYQSAGNVTVAPPENPGGSITVDSTPTLGSPNAVSSDGVAQALEGLLMAEGTEAQYVKGNGDYGDFTAEVTAIVEGIVGEGGGGGSSSQSWDDLEDIPADLIFQEDLDDEFGVEITGVLNLTPVTATRYASYSQTIARSVFSMTGGNAQLTLVSAPAGCVVVIGETSVTIAWVPIMSGEHYVVFWLSNGKKLGRPASLKITVSPGETITPIGDLVLTTASISAGKLVNIYDDAGTPKMRLAIATSVGTIAVAFVTQNAASGGELVPKYSGQVNPYFTGLTPGKRYFLSTTVPGGISEFGPAANSGHVWQPVGRAISETELLLDIDEHIVRSGS
jgi:hypothetical protein